MRYLDAAGSGLGEFPKEMGDLDACGRGWTTHNVIRNQQVSGSSPLAGSNRINNLQRSAAGRSLAVSTPCPAVSITPRGQAAGKWPVEAPAASADRPAGGVWLRRVCDRGRLSDWTGGQRRGGR